jgi:hypothetical protein
VSMIAVAGVAGGISHFDSGLIIAIAVLAESASPTSAIRGSIVRMHTGLNFLGGLLGRI